MLCQAPPSRHRGYDTDKFRECVFMSELFDRFTVHGENWKDLRDDDVALLRFAYKWFKFALFGEKTLGEKKVGGGRREDEPDDDQAA